MDDEKETELVKGTEPPEKPSTITEGGSNLIDSITITVKDAASAIVEVAKSSSSVSNRVETAVPPVEENVDAPLMAADYLAAYPAADTQPVIAAQLKKPRAKKKALSKSIANRMTNILVGANQAPASKKKAPAKKVVAKKVAKKAAKKSTAKKASKKSKKAAPEKTMKKSAKKSAKKTEKKRLRKTNPRSNSRWLPPDPS